MNTQTTIDLSNLTSNSEATWFITKDEGVCNDCTDATDEQKKQLRANGYTETFKMYDDDNELYYTGYAKPDTDFEPLDDFGMPNAGCTTISYRNPVTKKFEII